MKDIKTKQTVHDIRVLDKSADIGHRMKNVYVRSKEQVEQIQRMDSDSPDEYADNKAQDSAADLSRDVRRGIRRQAQKLFARTRNQIKNRKETGTGTPFSDTPASENNPSTYNTQIWKVAKDRMMTSVSNRAGKARKRAPGSAYGIIPQPAENSISRSAKVAEKAIKQHVNVSAKTAEKSIKTAEKSSKVAVKTSRAAAETARKTTQATVKASQKATQATRAAAKAATVTANSLAKAADATVKAVITTVKGLVTVIAAGGWIAIAVIVVIAAVGFVFCSPLGIFASEQGYEDKVSYFWGGKSLLLGWDSRWGMPMKVTAGNDTSTGTVRPFGLDCSGFVDWVFYNSYDGDYIFGHGGGAESQFSYCDPIAWNNAQPGDLVFYPDCEHVGIVVKNDAGTLTVIHSASGYNNVVMTQHTQDEGFTFTGRPQKYGRKGAVSDCL